MIKYNAIQNRYLYRMEDLDKILNIIQNGNYYNMNYCTQENISLLVKSVNEFMANIEVISENSVLERHETEAEAREYFGDDFISKFDNLLTVLDKQETIVAIHGTNEKACPLICENGLKYKRPSLSSTAVQQDMAYGQSEMHYVNYEGLLNWGHKNYKGLVILAIPYECYYKEGLWNKYQDTGLGIYGVQDYKIDPDFIAGYIDVTKKQLVINPKYNRQHNYDGYVKDEEIFREQLDMDNNKIKQKIIASKALNNQKSTNNNDEPKDESKNEQMDISRIPYVIEELIGTFNSIKVGFPNGMTEERYKYFLKELSQGFNNMVNVVSLLKTNDQIKKEEEEKPSSFNENSNDVFSDGDFDWNPDPSWGPRFN